MMITLIINVLNVFFLIYFLSSSSTKKSIGEIELEHLPLKRDLIRYLGLPLEANDG